MLQVGQTVYYIGENNTLNVDTIIELWGKEPHRYCTLHHDCPVMNTSELYSDKSNAISQLKSKLLFKISDLIAELDSATKKLDELTCLSN